MTRPASGRRSRRYIAAPGPAPLGAQDRQRAEQAAREQTKLHRFGPDAWCSQNPFQIKFLMDKTRGVLPGHIVPLGASIGLPD